MSDLDDLEEIADLFAPPSMTEHTARGLRRQERQRRGGAKSWQANRAKGFNHAREAARYRRSFYARSNSEPRSPGTGERGSK